MGGFLAHLILTTKGWTKWAEEGGRRTLEELSLLQANFDTISST